MSSPLEYDESNGEILDKSKLAEFNITEQTVTNGIIHTRAPEAAYLESRYEFGEKLGQGAFGTVQTIISKAKLNEFACKLVKKMNGNFTGYEQVQREIQIMKKISHKNIVKLYEVLETPTKVYLVLEMCAGGELVKQVRNQPALQEKDCRIIISRLTDAIDIKPENVLLSNETPNDPWNIKLADFGLATASNATTMMENMCGTPLYMAPEIHKNLGYSCQCDIWSIGIMLYLLLCSYKKEAENDLIPIIQTNFEIKYPEKYFANVSPSAKQLLDLMLRIDPAKRISALEILSSSWIKGESSASKQMGNTNVLDMMKSYNAERRLRKGMIVVRMAIRWRNLGLMRGALQSQVTNSTQQSNSVSTLPQSDHEENSSNLVVNKKPDLPESKNNSKIDSKLENPKIHPSKVIKPQASPVQSIPKSIPTLIKGVSQTKKGDTHKK